MLLDSPETWAVERETPGRGERRHTHRGYDSYISSNRASWRPVFLLVKDRVVFRLPMKELLSTSPSPACSMRHSLPFRRSFFALPSPVRGTRKLSRHAGNFGTYRLGPHPRIHDNWSPAARGSLTTQYPYVEGSMKRNLGTYAQVC